MPVQAWHVSPHEGQSMWDSASITLGCAKRSLLFFISSSRYCPGFCRHLALPMYTDDAICKSSRYIARGIPCSCASAKLSAAPQKTCFAYDQNLRRYVLGRLGKLLSPAQKASKARPLHFHCDVAILETVQQLDAFTKDASFCSQTGCLKNRNSVQMLQIIDCLDKNTSTYPGGHTLTNGSQCSHCDQCEVAPV